MGRVSQFFSSRGEQRIELNRSMSDSRSCHVTLPGGTGTSLPLLRGRPWLQRQKDPADYTVMRPLHPTDEINLRRNATDTVFFPKYNCMTKVQIPKSTPVSGDGEVSKLRIRQPVEAHSRLYTGEGWVLSFRRTRPARTPEAPLLIQIGTRNELYDTAS
jgi:hypothetical protein